MQWLLHGDVAEQVAQALAARGDKVHRPENSVVDDILETARKNQWDLITTDAALAHSLSSGKFKFARSVVHLQAKQDEAIERLFVRFKRLTPGRLYTVTGSRVKVRQLPARPRASAAANVPNEETP
jgi:hypothetical protein